MSNYRPQGLTNPYKPSNPKEGCGKEDLFEAGADAMLKNVVEWLEERNVLVIKDGKKIRGIPDKDWQSLLKGAGL